MAYRSSNDPAGRAVEAENGGQPLLLAASALPVEPTADAAALLAKPAEIAPPL
jgi:hypothetical protein